MRLRYTRQAAAELDEILASIAEHSPRGAHRVQARIRQAVRRLTSHPSIGQATDDPRLRRLVATPYRFLIFYETTANEVVIIGVRHGARDPGLMPGGNAS